MLCRVCGKEHRPLYVIASDIKQHWLNPTYAMPYIHAMSALVCPKQDYGFDRGKDIVLYFLANAQSWRGDDARRIKQELKEAIK